MRRRLRYEVLTEYWDIVGVSVMRHLGGVYTQLNERRRFRWWVGAVIYAWYKRRPCGSPFDLIYITRVSIHRLP